MLQIASIELDERIYGPNSRKLAKELLQLAVLYVRNRHKPVDGTDMFVKGGQLLQRAQEILTSDETSIGSDAGQLLTIPTACSFACLSFRCESPKAVSHGHDKAEAYGDDRPSQVRSSR